MAEEIDSEVVKEVVELSDSLEELCEEYDIQIALNSLVTVLTWYLAEHVALNETSPDQEVDNLCIGIKQGVKEMMEIMQESERKH